VELELACWYGDDDMTALAASSHLAQLQVLVLWLGRREEAGTDANLCRNAARAQAWQKLRELVLLDPEGTNEKPVKRLVTAVNRTAGRKIGKYERGYPELFPFAPGYRYAFPGHLPDGRTALAALELGPNPHRDAVPLGLIVLTFDKTGAQTDDVIRVPLSPILAKIKLVDSYKHKADYQQHLIDTTGFVPGFIRVKGYRFPDQTGGPYRGHSEDWDLCGRPDEPDGDPEGDPEHERGYGGQVYWLVRNGEFEVGSSGWADKRGLVHST
jgi:hypothetical protein